MFSQSRATLRSGLFLAASLCIGHAHAASGEDTSFNAASKLSPPTAMFRQLGSADDGTPHSFADAAREGRDDRHEQAGVHGAAASAVPEPGSAVLLLAGAGLIALRVRRSPTATI